MDDTRPPAEEAPARPSTAEPSEPSPGRANQKRVTSPVLLPRRPKPWRGGAGLSRWTTIGCAIGILVLIALLMFGVSLARRTAWMALERSARRLMAGVEQQRDAAERLRISRNLERFKVQLRLARDPYPMMGEFMRLVQQGFEDGSLTAEELAAINRYIESTLPIGSGLQQ